MRGFIKEYGKHYLITGLRVLKTVDLKCLMKILKEKQGCVVQVFNADLIAGWEHLFFAALNSLKAFESKRNISKNLSIEMLLYASMQRQISNALKSIGVKPDLSRIAVIILSDSEKKLQECLKEAEKFFGGVADDEVLSVDRRKLDLIKTAFRITDEELKAVGQTRTLEEAIKYTVIERMALLYLQK
ncbi:hypothetical protein DRO58_08170 [Candidatus Bathyarchaeota archaeon]|nr:MAG: hypothetical protein DRO58_08170 [Candidatus Bathyarchaeota archaeon]